ncbi:putative geraniol 8-hydroxylase [Helianthus annuus]|nr:putative geraniol 8-hydroxylase [Helianthus annuus]
MSLKLGTRTIIVVSSLDMAKEFFQKHDHSFSSRSIPDMSRLVDHDKYSMVWLPQIKQRVYVLRATSRC